MILILIMLLINDINALYVLLIVRCEEFCYDLFGNADDTASRASGDSSAMFKR